MGTQFKNLFLSLVFLSTNLVQAKVITVTMTGDIGFNKTDQSPQADGVNAYGKMTSWKSLTQNIKDYVQGDLIFGNIETVLSEKNLQDKQNKKFKFISHPNSVQHLIKDLGYNVLSTANNHSGDYGQEGLDHTDFWMKTFEQKYGIAHHGIGTYDEIIQPRIFKHEGQTIAFAAIGINSYPQKISKSSSQISSLNFRSNSHLDALISAMNNTSADLKIVSVHYGTEGKITLDQGQKAAYHRLVDEAGADLVIGHHPHIVRPIERYKDSAIIYSLGNFLLIGASNIDGRAHGKDYGIIARAAFNISAGKAELVAVEVTPIQGMHYKPHILSPEKAKSKIDFLNTLSSQELGSSALKFETFGETGYWHK